MNRISWQSPAEYNRIINLQETLDKILQVVIGVGVFTTTVLVVFASNTRTIFTTSMLAFVGTILYLLNRKGQTQIASFGAFLLTISALTFIQIENNGLYDVSVLGYPAIIVFSSLLMGRNFVIPITLISASLISLVQRLTLTGFIQPYEGDLITTQQDYWSIVAAVLVTGTLVYIIMTIIEQNITKILVSEERIKQVYESTLKGWARALELRDHETEGHSQRVTELTIRLAEKLSLSGNTLTAIRWGALLHDIGKMSVPDEVLLKNSSLTAEEFEVIKKHPQTAKELLQNIPYLQNALEIPNSHHERWDGSGYPAGLAGEAIPLPARIFAVIDVWDALRSKRPYKEAWSDEEALDHLKKQAGTLFDPNVVRAFEELLVEEPDLVKAI